MWVHPLRGIEHRPAKTQYQQEHSAHAQAMNRFNETMVTVHSRCAQHFGRSRRGEEVPKKSQNVTRGKTALVQNFPQMTHTAMSQDPHVVGGKMNQRQLTKDDHSRKDPASFPERFSPFRLERNRGYNKSKKQAKPLWKIHGIPFICLVILAQAILAQGLPCSRGVHQFLYLFVCTFCW